MTYSSDPSERARQLVAEGRFGGAGRGQGRPRVRRATEIAAEAAIQHADEIVAALLSALDPEETADTRSKGAARWLELIVREGGLQQRERAQDRADDAFALMSTDELATVAAQALVSMVESGEIDVAQVAALAPAIEVEPMRFSSAPASE